MICSGMRGNGSARSRSAGASMGSSALTSGGRKDTHALVDMLSLSPDTICLPTLGNSVVLHERAQRKPRRNERRETVPICDISAIGPFSALVGLFRHFLESGQLPYPAGPPSRGRSPRTSRRSWKKVLFLEKGPFPQIRVCKNPRPESATEKRR
jgi:hypothetical protein